MQSYQIVNPHPPQEEVQILQQQNQRQNIQIQQQVVIPQRNNPQLLLQFQPQQHVPVNPGNAIMDDFNNIGGKKYYWNKELVKGSKTQYRWEKRLIPPLPEKSVQAFLQIPQNTIKTMEFPTKQSWFRLNLEQLRIPWQQGSDSLHVTKDSFLMSTLGSIQGVNWHKEVKIIIEEEKVLDAGGLLREWINLIMKEILHPESGMFNLAETEDVSYKINSDADPVDHVLDCFRLLGIVVGKAIFERIPLNAFFDRTLMRHMLGQNVVLDDIYFYDKQLGQSWQYLLENEFDPDELMERFVIYRKGKDDFYELKVGGAQIIVDNENKKEYVNLCIEYYSYQSIKPFLQAFLNQLYTIVPKKLLAIFEPLELDMILYGIPFINLEDWKENTDYKGAYYRTHQTIQWFWQILGELDQTNLGKFLQFCTGTQRTPVEGFRKLESNRGNTAKFCIESVPFTRANPYPKAHTCFNRLELPLYSQTIEQLLFRYEKLEDITLYLKSVIMSDLDGVFGLE